MLVPFTLIVSSKEAQQHKEKEKNIPPSLLLLDPAISWVLVFEKQCERGNEPRIASCYFPSSFLPLAPSRVVATTRETINTSQAQQGKARREKRSTVAAVALSTRRPRQEEKLCTEAPRKKRIERAKRKKGNARYKPDDSCLFFSFFHRFPLRSSFHSLRSIQFNHIRATLSSGAQE